jgi:hypothetical protein
MGNHKPSIDATFNPCYFLLDSTFKMLLHDQLNKRLLQIAVIQERHMLL